MTLLGEKGALKESVEWAGRTNDKKKNKLQGLDEVYTGGKGEDRMARSVEVALTQRDEFGRVLTPKERFRELSYRFHGKAPSKNKIEAKMKKDAQTLAIKKAVTSEKRPGELDKLEEVQKRLGTPFVVLSGKGQQGNAIKGDYPALAKKSRLGPGGVSSKKGKMPPPPAKKPK